MTCVPSMATRWAVPMTNNFTIEGNETPTPGSPVTPIQR